MSAGNYFETRRSAYNLRTKEITTSSTLSTYTTRAGGAKDSFIEDRVIKVTTTTNNSLTITVSDGTYEGQRLLIIFETEETNEGVTLTPVTGSITNLSAQNDYTSLEWVGALGWKEMHNTIAGA